MQITKVHYKRQNLFWSEINRRKIPIRFKLTGIDERLALRCGEGLGEKYFCWDHGKMKVGGEISPRLNLRDSKQEGENSNNHF